ncbi:MAG: NifU family protein [Planctomycetota bacterium]
MNKELPQYGKSPPAPAPPQAPPPQNADVPTRVAYVLEAIRPAVQSDGGDIEFVEVTDRGVVRIRLHGACVGCPSSTLTLKYGIENNLRDYVPEVTGVEAVE